MAQQLLAVMQAVEPMTLQCAKQSATVGTIMVPIEHAPVARLIGNGTYKRTNGYNKYKLDVPPFLNDIANA